MDLEGFVAWGTVTYGWNPLTRKQYRTSIERFTRWLDTQRLTLDNAGPQECKLWLATLPPTAASINQATKPLRRWGEWLAETGRRDTNPCAGLKPLRQPARAPRPYTPTEAGRLLERAAAEGGAAAVAVALQLLAGLRHAEMRTLRWADVERDKLHVTGKGDKQRRVPVHPTLRQILVAWRLASPPSDWVFPSPQNGARPASESSLRLWTAPVLQGQRPHRLRATFATDVGRRKGAYAVRDLLGHASVATSAFYVKFEEDELTSAVAGLSYAEEA